MTLFVNVLLLAALALTAFAWALEWGSRMTQLATATGVTLALNVAAIWQDMPWYTTVVYGGLLGLLIPALRREQIRRNAATTTGSKPTS
ncbi:hypothetical protein [Streptomyces flaveolus]|uniref:hypothetical protein n=1 Tax=Streptomyces flaveolus TaxID=67297 RepID=UPI0033D0FE3A